MEILLSGFLVIGGIYAVIGVLLYETIQQAKKRPAIKTALQILVINLAEPFISTCWFLPMLLLSPKHPFFNWLNLPVEANTTALFGLYHWPMIILLSVLPLCYCFNAERLVIKTALVSWAIGAMRIIGMWLLYHYQISFLLVMGMLLSSISSFSLIGAYLDYLYNRLPSEPTPKVHLTKIDH